MPDLMGGDNGGNNSLFIFVLLYATGIFYTAGQMPHDPKASRHSLSVWSEKCAINSNRSFCR